MSLYINLDQTDTTKIISYGKQGQVQIDSWPSIDGQPARKNQCYWNGSSVQLKTNEMLVSEYLEQKIDETRTLATTRWIDSTKAITAIQANYNVFKSANYNSMAEVDAAFNDFIQFMEI